MVVDPDEQAQFLQIMNNHVARFISIETAILLRCIFIDTGIDGENIDHLEAMTLTNGVVIEIVCRSNLDAASPKFRINIVIGNNRNFTIAERQ